MSSLAIVTLGLSLHGARAASITLDLTGNSADPAVLAPGAVTPVGPGVVLQVFATGFATGLNRQHLFGPTGLGISPFDLEDTIAIGAVEAVTLRLSGLTGDYVVSHIMLSIDSGTMGEVLVAFANLTSAPLTPTFLTLPVPSPGAAMHPGPYTGTLDLSRLYTPSFLNALDRQSGLLFVLDPHTVDTPFTGGFHIQSLTLTRAGVLAIPLPAGLWLLLGAVGALAMTGRGTT